MAIIRALQLSKMRIERDGADGGFVAGGLSERRKVGSVADAAHVQLLFGDSDSRDK